MHCLEAALAAAVILERHGYPPLVLSFESIDHLDHVIFVYQRGHRWGSIARSRDPGLHGRKPVFRTPRDLALSYVDPYIDFTGRVTGYAVVDLRIMGNYDWRLSEQNVWKVERVLLDYPHRPIRSSDQRINALRKRYRAFKKQFPDRKPLYYRGRNRWSDLPSEFPVASVEIEIARRLGDRFLPRLSQCFLETLGERVAAGALVLDGLREDRFTASRRIGQDALGIAELRLVLVLGLDVPHDPPQVRVDHEHCAATRARHIEFRFEFRHLPLAPHSAFSIQHC